MTQRVSGRLLWGVAAVIVVANTLLAIVWPAPHGGQPEALYVAGACHAVPFFDYPALRACIEQADPRMTYGLPWHVMSVWAAKAFGETWTAQILLAGLTFLWALVGTGRLGALIARENEMERPDLVALTAMGLLAACPLVPALARQPQLDLFQAGVAAWSLLWLARSDGLRHKGLAAAVGGLLAYSLMVKPTMAFFVVPAAATAWWFGGKGLRDRLPGLAGLFLVFVGFLLGYLGYRADTGAWDDTRMTGSSVRGDPLEFPFYGIYSGLPDAPIRDLYYFTRMLLNYQSGYFVGMLALVAMIAVLWGMWKGESRRRVGSVLAVAAFVGGYLFHTWLAYKKYYYTVPALPGVMAVAAAFAWSLKGRVGRPLRIALVVVCVLMTARQQLGLPGPDDLLSPYMRYQFGFNEPRAFTPEPQFEGFELERDLPFLLSLAHEQAGAEEEPDVGSVPGPTRETVHVALLPLGPKMEVLGGRPEVHGFRHAWMYELQRRNIGLIKITPEKEYRREGRLQAFFVFALPGEELKVPTPDDMLGMCRIARGTTLSEPAEMRGLGSCVDVARWWATLHPHMRMVSRGPHAGRGERGLVVVAPARPDGRPRPEAAAPKIAETMGAIFPR